MSHFQHKGVKIYHSATEFCTVQKMMIVPFIAKFPNNTNTMDCTKSDCQPLQQTLQTQKLLSVFSFPLQEIRSKQRCICMIRKVQTPGLNYHLPCTGDRPPLSLPTSSSNSIPSKLIPFLLILISELALLLVACGESETLTVLVCVRPDLTLYIDDAGILVINGRKLPGMVRLIPCSTYNKQIGKLSILLIPWTRYKPTNASIYQKETPVNELQVFAFQERHE